jgi:hypothetical protein
MDEAKTSIVDDENEIPDCMTQKQVAYVARAFYEVEFPGTWDHAQGSIQEHFRDLARMTIATLNRQIAQCRRSATKPSAISYPRRIA